MRQFYTTQKVGLLLILTIFQLSPSHFFFLIFKNYQHLVADSERVWPVLLWGSFYKQTLTNPFRKGKVEKV